MARCPQACLYVFLGDIAVLAPTTEALLVLLGLGGVVRKYRPTGPFATSFPETAPCRSIVG